MKETIQHGETAMKMIADALASKGKSLPYKFPDTETIIAKAQERTLAFSQEYEYYDDRLKEETTKAFMDGAFYAMARVALMNISKNVDKQEGLPTEQQNHITAYMGILKHRICGFFKSN